MKYKLSKSGIERLEQFKCDVENGDYNVKEVHYRGQLVHLVVENDDRTCCLFDDLDKQNCMVNTLNSIDRTLSGEIKVGKHGDDSEYYYVTGGCGLTDSDVELADA